MAFKRVLTIVDDSESFMKKGSDLPVGENGEGAEELINPTNEFLTKIPANSFDFALFDQDTHFEVEYALSPEAASFNMHNEYGSDGWKLAVNPELLHESIPVFYMSKNTFDMWGNNPIPMEKLLAHHGASSFDELPFKNETEKKAYSNLFHITEDPACLTPGIHRDVFMENIGPGTEVVLAGVASNFCDADAMFGYLARGAHVTVLSDLVKGIPLGQEGQEFLLGATGIDRTAGGTIEEVLETERFKLYVGTGLLQVMISQDFLQNLQSRKPEFFPAPPGP